MQSNNYNLIFFDEITSTNDYLKAHYDVLANNTFIQTNFQTKGRGQFARTWESNKGENILISWLVKKNVNTLKFKNHVTAVIINWLNDYGIKGVFKYPNDIYANGNKIVGILIETKGSIKMEYLICGIGINVNQIYFDEVNAISMKNITNKHYNLENITKKLIKMLI